MSILSKVRATALFQSFHGRLPGKGEIVTIKQTEPEITLEVGQLYGVMYKVNGIEEPYLHKFTASSRPLLFVSADGKQIYVVKGKYRFTDRGFIG